MKQITQGATDQSTVIRIVDSADGTPETGVTSATAGLALQYRREGGLNVALTESDLATLDAVHADGGMIHIGAGYYRVDLPDAAVAAGADGVLVHGAVTGMVVIGSYHELVAAKQTGDSFARLGVNGGGLTALGDTRIANLDATVTSRASQATADAIEVDTQDLQARTPAALIGGRIDATVGAMQTGVVTATAVASDAHEEAADTLLGRNVAGGSNGGRMVKSALYRLINRVAIAAGVLTVYRTDDTTAEFTQNVTTTAGDPISEVDTV